MPELPEVESWRRLAHAHAVGKKIRGAFTDEDRIIFDRNAPSDVAKALKGCRIIDSARKGKHCWMILDNGLHLYLHFGMTGSLWWLARSVDPEPSHVKCRLDLEDGSRLIYRNMRRIGKVRLLADATAVPPVSLLGPDPLSEGIPLKWLEEQLAKRQTPIKAVLLDQKVFAGIGNWIADEMLYQAGMDPHRICSSLRPAEIKNLHNCMMRILRKAVAVDADASRFPKSWLFHHRWGKKATHTAAGEQIRFDQIGGRTTAWVPSRVHLTLPQKKIHHLHA
jgi:formamidopyrimidine-DNA glycosylase